MIAMVDYGMGNRRSVEKALEHVGARPVITSDAEAIRAADGTPVLGICLGMQLLFEASAEHEGAAGLGLLPGEVTPLDAPKLPHIGWNRVALERPSGLTAGLGEAAAFYHVHTVACRPRDASDVVGRGEYGERFVSIVERGNVMGAQFHPEKSSLDGLALLRNFAGARVHA